MQPKHSRKAFKVRTSAVIIALTTILGGQAALASAVEAAPYTAPSIVAKQTAPIRLASLDNTPAQVDGYTYEQKFIDALNHINDIRAKIGAPPVKLDPYLTKAAQNHANWLTTNGSNKAPDGHTEVQGTTGFTGVGFVDRIKATGASSEVYNIANEGIDYSYNDPSSAVDDLLAGAYHRISLMDPRTTHVGLGLSGSTFVIEYSIQGKTKGAFTYPYDGQTSVPVLFQGNSEKPNPLEQFGVGETGFPIALLISGVSVTQKNVTSAYIKDSQGNDIPYYGGVRKGTLLFYSKEVLKTNETYTVSVTYSPDYGPDEGKSFTKTWSFTTSSKAGDTGRPSTSGQTAPTPKPTPQASSSNYSNTNVGIKINGKYVDVNPKPLIVNESTFIPLRGVFEAIGADVNWKQAPSSTTTQSGESIKPDYIGTVTITKGSTKVILYVGTTRATVNGKAVELSTPSFISDAGSTYVPLRFISETIGAKVGWDADNWTAVIETP